MTICAGEAGERFTLLQIVCNGNDEFVGEIKQAHGVLDVFV